MSLAALRLAAAAPALLPRPRTAAEARIRPFLAAGEQLVWTGTPDRRVYASRSRRNWPGAALGLTAAGLAAGLGLILGAATAPALSDTGLPAVAGLLDPLVLATASLLVVAGAGLRLVALVRMAQRRAERAREASGVVYAITDRRVLVLDDASPVGPVIDPRHFPPAGWHVVPVAGGRGSLIFGRVQERDDEPPQNFGFHGVADVARAAALARRAVGF
jgi:hypothetical protein